MKKINTLIIVFALALASSAFAQEVVTPDQEVRTEKRAQTGMKFLSTSVDARAAALGGALTADTRGSSAALFYNPASMALFEGTFHGTAAQLQFIADINYNIASIAFRPSGGNYGIFGISFIDVDYGEFIGTIRANNERGFVETGNYSPTAMSVGLGYARSFTDRFSVGAQFKYVTQDIGTGFATSTTSGAEVTGTSFDSGQIATTEDYSQNTIAVDFGVLYKTGFKSLTIAMSARNFSRELRYERERFELPLTFQIGAEFNAIDLTSLDPEQHALVLHVDAQRPRDFDEHVRWGVEYTFMNLISIRGGFEQMGVSEEQGFSAGAGVHVDIQDFTIGADYAYTEFGVFGDVQRIGLQIGF